MLIFLNRVYQSLEALEFCINYGLGGLAGLVDVLFSSIRGFRRYLGC